LSKSLIWPSRSISKLQRMVGHTLFSLVWQFSNIVLRSFYQSELLLGEAQEACTLNKQQLLGYLITTFIFSNGVSFIISFMIYLR